MEHGEQKLLPAVSEKFSEEESSLSSDRWMGPMYFSEELRALLVDEEPLNFLKMKIIYHFVIQKN